MEEGDICPKCKCCSLIWHDCYNCDEFGFSHHECGEDSCCCTDTSFNAICEICEGEEGWLACPHEDCEYNKLPKKRR